MPLDEDLDECKLFSRFNDPLLSGLFDEEVK
jgi:hypothetical protein